MREVYLQIAVAVIVEVIEAEPAEKPVLIVDLLRNLGCVKQFVRFIVIVEIYRSWQIRTRVCFPFRVTVP